MRKTSIYYTPVDYEYIRKENEKSAKFVGIFGVIILILCIGFGSYLFVKSDTSEWPEIVSVEMLDSKPISLKELESYDDSNEDKINILDCSDDYKFKVTLADGNEYEVSGFWLSGNVFDDYYRGEIQLTAYVSVKQCRENLSRGENTIDVNVRAVFGQGGRYSSFTPVHEYETTVKKEVAECHVKSIEHISDKPLKFYHSSNFHDIIGEKFLITYADGRKVRTKAEMKYDSDGLWYIYIDGYEADITETYDGKIEVKIMDGVCVLEGTFYSLPYESLEITDCVFDGKGIPIAVSYILTRTDKTTIEKTDYVTDYIDEFGGRLKEDMEGHWIFINSEKIYNGAFNDMEIKVTATVAEYYTRPIVYEKTYPLPESDCDCICHSSKGIVWKYNNFVRKIEKLLSMDEKCECGEIHYDK